MGEKKGGGDTVIDMDSFQQYFVLGGKRNIYLYTGVDPIADTSGDTVGFSPTSLFPQGLASPNSLVSIGNDIVFITPDGIQAAGLRGGNTLPTRENLSEAIKEALRTEIKSATDDQIRIFHYPRRSWICVKVGSKIYNFNYPANLADLSQPASDVRAPSQTGSWSIFDGKFARQNAYFIRRNFDLVCCGPQGKVYRFDDEGVYDDDGEGYTTEYET